MAASTVTLSGCLVLPVKESCSAYQIHMVVVVLLVTMDFIAKEVNIVILLK